MTGALFNMTGALHPLVIRGTDPTKGTSFGIGQRIGGRMVEFTFRWNTKYGRYSVTMIDRNGEFYQFFPQVGTEEVLRNFDPTNLDARDALIGVATSKPSKKLITPRNLGRTHGLYVATGRIVR